MDIQQNNVAVLHFNLVNQDGSTIFIRKTKLATFNLINPSAVSVPITDIGFDATLNQCWIRIPKASNATTGQYYGVLNIVDDDWGTYTTSKIKIYSVVSDSDADTKSVVFTATCIATQVTNPSGGNSPYYNTTTGTWWQYSDTLKAFEDTGVGADIASLEANVNVINVDVEYPLNNGYYTINTARSIIPSNHRKSNKILVFKESENNTVMWLFSGISDNTISYWGNDVFWRKLTEKKYYSLEWGGSANNTRVKVNRAERTSGMIIYYNNGTEDVYELYVGESYADGDAYWNSFLRINTYEQLTPLLQYYATPIFATGKYSEAIKELYIEKYEEGASYKISHLANTSDYHGLIWIQKVGDTGNIVQNNNTGITNGVVTLSSSDGTFIAHIVLDWSKIPVGFNSDVNILIQEQSKNIEYSPTVYAKLKAVPGASVANSLQSRLYNKEESVVHENTAEAVGDTWYQYDNIGLVYKATEKIEFDSVIATLNQGSAIGNLIVKYGAAVSANGGTIVFKSENYILPDSGRVTIALDVKVTLNAGEYIWIYYTGNTRMRAWLANNDSGTRIGVYFQKEINVYRYSTDITLFVKKGDIIEIDDRLTTIEKEVGNGEVTTPMITLPENLYVITGREQPFYYNEFIFGIESNQDNTLLSYNIGAQLQPQSGSLGMKCVSTKEGFTIYTKTEGNYTIKISIYDQFNNLLISKETTLHSFNATSLIGKSILMLGDSWTDINTGDKGYTSYTDKALKEIGITMNFIGTRDAGTSGLKHEGIGGYDWIGFASKPTVVRLKFYVDSMPSISNDDIYSNNGSTYTLREKGSNYITLNRTTGNTEPTGNTLAKVSGTGDGTITFLNWTTGGSNPLWNSETDTLDFTHYRRDLCGLSSPLNLCNIQLGVNDCLSSNLKITRFDWGDTLIAVTSILNAILADSPDCKIIVNLVGMDAPSTTAWASLSGLTDAKRRYQVNCYYLRTYINELIMSRDDYNTKVFIGQSVLGINRWYGYGYTDRRYRYFAVDKENMSDTDLQKIEKFDYQQRSVYMYTDNAQEFMAYSYDSRGYLVCLAQQGFANGDIHNQEFVNDYSVTQNNIPEAGSLTKGGGSSSVDFPVVPYTACYIENNNSKEHYFMNASHPYDLGYRQMAYTLANQIASMLI